MTRVGWLTAHYSELQGLIKRARTQCHPSSGFDEPTQRQAYDGKHQPSPCPKHLLERPLTWLLNDNDSLLRGSEAGVGGDDVTEAGEGGGGGDLEGHATSRSQCYGDVGDVGGWGGVQVGYNEFLDPG